MKKVKAVRAWAVMTKGGYIGIGSYGHGLLISRNRSWLAGYWLGTTSREVEVEIRPVPIRRKRHGK